MIKNLRFTVSNVLYLIIRKSELLSAGSQWNCELNIDLLAPLILLKNCVVGGNHLNNFNVNVWRKMDTEWIKFFMNFLAKYWPFQTILHLAGSSGFSPRPTPSAVIFILFSIRGPEGKILESLRQCFCPKHGCWSLTSEPYSLPIWGCAWEIWQI